jgi:hypothetical protein
MRVGICDCASDAAGGCEATAAAGAGGACEAAAWEIVSPCATGGCEAARGGCDAGCGATGGNDPSMAAAKELACGASVGLNAMGGGAMERPLDGAIAPPHSPQNFCVGGLAAPQSGHASTDEAGRRMGGNSNCASASSSAAENSSAVLNRCLASLAKAMRQTSTRACGMPRSGATLCRSGGASEMCISTTCVGDSASKGSRPVSSWYMMTPTAYKSLRASS